ncbi:response regulator transcription factor [Salegentibacter flavus]|uniref:DNA-binding response regulator, NarL/FixJ family, contains REC and HTH domains n=1 Tax=Salegentibacter flavus TaxID=287099 RepID=A0A1I5BAD7_9FLAO|nr:response regulator transcription factor [Salegentibacter flavus]SFN71688.1 DNA-binding response regulator, NarL/FixJ family, contains REC and HTH domains [Salegentibacter flavus]
MHSKLLLFEKDEKLRESLKAVLESGGEYVVLGAYENVKDIAAILRLEKPDLVILDAGMPEGITAISIIKKERPETLVLIYTSVLDEEKLFKCFCQGANGFLLKNTSLIEVYEGVNELRDGGAPMSPAAAKLVLESFRKPSKKNEENYNLTDREIEVLKLLIKGLSVKRIASELNMAFETSRSHLRNIYQKLNVHCGKEAIAKVFTEKINLK